MPISEYADRAACLQTLRDLVQFLESHPDVPMPFIDTVNVYPETKEALARIVRSAGGKFKKSSTAAYFHVDRQIGLIDFRLSMSHETACERVVVGKRVVEALPERILPARPAEEVDVVEWRCPAILESVERTGS